MTARGIRNRNPGNLDFNKAAFALDPWLGELGLEKHVNPRFTTFDTARHGIRALCKTGLTYYRHRKAADGSKINTAEKFTARWAPPSENDTGAYAAAVRKALGVEKGQVIDLENPAILTKLAAAIIQHENGAQPYSEYTLRAGVVMALEWPVIGLEVTPPPKPLELWTATEGKAKVRWMPDDEFNALARQHGIDPEVKDAFTVPPGWYNKWPLIYMRARSLGLFPEHEARHAEDMLQGRANFHG